MGVSEKAAVRKSNVEIAAKAVADEEKYVTWTSTIGDEELELTAVRDPLDGPWQLVRFIGAKANNDKMVFITLLLGEDQSAKLEALEPSGYEFLQILDDWSKATKLEGK